MLRCSNGDATSCLSPLIPLLSQMDPFRSTFALISQRSVTSSAVFSDLLPLSSSPVPDALKSNQHSAAMTSSKQKQVCGV